MKDKGLGIRARVASFQGPPDCDSSTTADLATRGAGRTLSGSLTSLGGIAYLRVSQETPLGRSELGRTTGGCWNGRMTLKPRILVFTGDGKGKTTAALGMAFRASGHSLRTCMIQFIKGDTSVGEIAAAAALATIEIHPTGLGFLPPPDHPRFAEHRAAAQVGLSKAADALAAGQFAIVVLDEICLAVARGLVEESQVVDLLAHAPANTCVVLTGREAPPALIALADTVTEMRCIKHGMQSGIAAQDGVER
jgi:cob(I)alamin adenosyltransferase